MQCMRTVVHDLFFYLSEFCIFSTEQKNDGMQIWEGNGVVAAGRVILGATKPSESAPGTVSKKSLA
jgi:nucleoside diphosphate kinase